MRVILCQLFLKPSLNQLALLGENARLQPLKGINLMNLTDAQLAMYGLPSHQILDRNPQGRSDELSHSQQRICGTSPGKSHHSTVIRAGTSNAGYTSFNWAGNVDYGNTGTYTEAEVTFKVPNEVPQELISGQADDDASFWAGGGGDNSEASNPLLVQAGVDTQWTGVSQYKIMVAGIP